MSALVDNTQTDLWVVDNRTRNANQLAQLDMRIGRHLESIPGVQQANPFVTGAAVARFPDGQSTAVTLLGSEAPRFALRPTKLIHGRVEDLMPEGAVSVDYYDRANLGNYEPGGRFEINNRQVYIGTRSKGIRAFGSIWVYSTAERVRAICNISANKASGFLIDLKPGADAVQVRDAINRSVPNVRAWLPRDFSRATVGFVLSTTSIAISTGLLVVFAIISGFVIVGLTLYGSAVDRIKDYATMKAIGAKNRYVTRLILFQAWSLATVGYGLACGLILMFKKGVSSGGAIFEYPWQFWPSLYLLILLISIGGSLIAVRRITKAEPASVFRM
jgi:putative ABC transport system permease protein